VEQVNIEIEIDNDYITELVSQEIAKRIVAEHNYENREAKYGIRNGVDKAIKQYIYSQKDTIIERVIVRASSEITKKGFKKLINDGLSGKL
jgi:hypothetical protein